MSTDRRDLKFYLFILLTVFVLFSNSSKSMATVPQTGITGSVSCRDCHEKFYSLWSTSYHGLAMQPFTAELARKELKPQKKDIIIEKYRYRAGFDDQSGWVMERGPEGVKKFPLLHALGGKNVYYFLTPLEKGRLQTLPIAYDINRKEWFDTAASGMRHVADEAVHWKDSVYTFNTACYRCHVSQISTNYDLKTNTYHTTWAEPGISCETCHSPGDEHIKVCREAPKGQTPKDLKIIRGGRDFTIAQRNAVCAPCHAQMIPLTDTFKPGERFFDHYNLVALEDEDFYPDGRDLGENYTETLWRMSPCFKSGQLSCMHCHTSSGRFLQKDDPNKACMPCHQKHVENPTAHSHHAADNDGNNCIACHMPMTEFARMRRSDHSMLPPTPLATKTFKSPNACNICHSDQDADWSETWVRKWYALDYQKPVLYRAGLIEAARKRDWTRLQEMLDYITSKDSDEIFTTSLIRLLRACDKLEKWPAILLTLAHPSPLVRSSAAVSLEQMPSLEVLEALIKAASDDYRLVRIQASASLSAYVPRLPEGFMNEKQRKNVASATDEFIASHMTRPDQWTSHYNLGNYYFDLNAPGQALVNYETALMLEPRAVLVLVNASMAYARQGQNDKAEELLIRALEIEPKSAVVHFNMGLLKAEQNDAVKAEKHFRVALKADPQMHEAAFNLGILISNTKPDEAISQCRRAYHLNPNPKYAYTLAFYLNQEGKSSDAVKVLLELIEKKPTYVDAYLMLGDIFEKQGNPEDARAVYQQALSKEGISQKDKYRFQALLGRGT
jgi:tetratricopeptide (TPR) repeat protein